MSKETLVNNAQDSLAAAITSTATTLTVTNASSFPTSGNFVVMVNGELMLVTGVSGTTFTVTRAIEGYPAQNHGSGSTVTAILSAGAMQRYGRDNNPYHDGARVPFALLDSSGNVLTSASFTVHNGAGDLHAAVVTDSDRRITIKRPAGQNASSSEALCSLVRSAPATPYTCVAAIDFDCVSDTAGRQSIGVGFRKSSTGGSLLLRIPLLDGSRDELNVNQASNEVTSGFVAAPDYFIAGNRHYFKFEDDGTNLTWFWSASGVNFIQVYQVARTTYFTGGPDQIVALAAGGNSNPYDFYASLLQYQE